MLPPEALRWSCPADHIEDPTGALPVPGTIGQDRALEALRLGLQLHAPGYHIYVAGLSGTGRMTTLRRILETLRPEPRPRPDRCYVFNFQDPDRPRLLTLPRGTAHEFRRAVEIFVESLPKAIVQRLAEEGFQRRREAVVRSFAEQERTDIRALEERLRPDGLVLARVERGETTQLDILVAGAKEPLTFDQYSEAHTRGQVPEEEFRRVGEAHRRHKADVERLARSSLGRIVRLRDDLARLEREWVADLLDTHIAYLNGKFPHEGVARHLELMKVDLLSHLDRFRADPGEGEEEPAAAPRDSEDRFSSYRVNVLLAGGADEAVPIVEEPFPTYSNLFGTIERVQSPSGAVLTDFTRIRPGSLLRADGGYLILNARDVLTQSGVWPMLKRVLKESTVAIQIPEGAQHVVPVAMVPEPIPVQVKVVLLGDAQTDELLAAFEEDFLRIFKIRADFDTEMENTPGNARLFAGVLRRIAREQGLRAPDPGAVAAVLEEAVRRAGRRSKISTLFGELADILREANFWAGQEKRDGIAASDVAAAISRGLDRNNLVETKIQEWIRDGLIRIDLDGSAVGQVNGLSVITLGRHAFGRPSRITATVGVGRAGVVNIEREVKLSGPIHDKGVLILTGFLRDRFAQEGPLSLSAGIAFEQSYSGIDGDSASAAELVALLSALSGVPVRQNLAITGSVDQRGTIQPVGGVNEKIEGFFHTCRARGLTGTQGVAIPATCADDLMLRTDVVDAVRAGKFGVHAISAIEEAVTLLTGRAYAEVAQAVSTRVRDLSQALRRKTR